MTDREILDEAYRYGYQGQYSEEDKTTGWNEFELRMYDARFGRWTSIDPYGQFASPYVGMGNNPGNGVDPDGGVFGNPNLNLWQWIKLNVFGKGTLSNTGKYIPEKATQGAGFFSKVKRFFKHQPSVNEVLEGAFQITTEFVEKGAVTAGGQLNGALNALTGAPLINPSSTSDPAAFEYAQNFGQNVTAPTISVLLVFRTPGASPVAVPLSPVSPVAVPTAHPISVPMVKAPSVHARAAKKATNPNPRVPKKIAYRGRFSTRKEAYEAAKRAGNGAEPVFHNDRHGPHFHPGDGNGKPLNHDHYYFPKRYL